MTDPAPTHAFPDDDHLLAIGKIAVRHGQLDNALRMIVGQLAGVSKEQALDATARQGSRDLRERIRKLAKKRLGEGPALVCLDALIERASRMSDKRNELLHSVWGRDFEGQDYVRGGDHAFRPAPPLAELADFLEQLTKLLTEVIDARFFGFLYEALTSTSSTPHRL